MKKLSLAGAIALAASHGYAETEEITIVSATRTEQNITEVLASVDLISKQDLQARQLTDLSSALANTVSLDIVRNGGPGAPASVLTRGANSNQTLFLVNGMRISSATLGSTAFQFIDPALVERVEIVRGSHSTLYGSEAIGGLVQIFTRPESDDTQHQLAAEAGSLNSQKLVGSSRGMIDNFHYSVGLSHSQSDGIDRLVDDTGNNADDDAWENTSLQVFAGYTFENELELNFSHLQSDAETEYDSAWVPSSSPFDKAQISASQIALIAPITDIFESQLSLGRSSDDSENHDNSLDGSTLTSAFKTTRHSLLWQNDFKVSELAHLTLGLDIHEAKIDTATRYTDSDGEPIDSETNSAVFGQWQGSSSAFRWKLGSRLDDHEAFGSETSSSAAIGIDFSDKLGLFASWSEGFKAPTFNDLYFPAGPFSAGNPELEPEQSENIEIGFRATHNQFQWQALIYQNDVENLIEWAPGEDFVWKPTNISSAELQGAEFNAAWSLASFELKLGGSYNSTENTLTGDPLINRSRQKYLIEFSQNLDRFNYGINLRHQGKRGTGNSAIDSHSIVNVFANWQVVPKLSVYSRIENLFDEAYTLNQGYNEEGFKAKIGLKLSF
jgi:vitamin B12 transporter